MIDVKEKGHFESVLVFIHSCCHHKKSDFFFTSRPSDRYCNPYAQFWFQTGEKINQTEKNAHICNQALHTLDLKLSAGSATVLGRLQATAVCAIAWQQALPEARVETDSAYSGVLKPAWLWRFDNGAQRMTDEHHKCWPQTQKKVSKGSKKTSLWVQETSNVETMASMFKLRDIKSPS